MKLEIGQPVTVSKFEGTPNWLPSMERTLGLIGQIERFTPMTSTQGIVRVVFRECNAYWYPAENIHPIADFQIFFP